MGIDRYGPLEFPASPPAPGEAAGDDALRILVDFAAAVLNANVTPAWAEVAPKAKVVETTYTHNPEREMFTDTALPALYCYREGGSPPAQDAHEWRRTHDQVSLVWVFPLQKQTVAKLRSPIVAALTKTMDKAFYQNRDPAYVHPGDDDPTAPTFTELLDAFLLLHATSTAPQTFTGPSLNGANAGNPISPPRGVVVELGGSPSSWSDGTLLRLVGTDILGNATTVPLVVTVSRIPGRLYSPISMKTLTSVQLDAQLGTAGTMRVGTGAMKGHGTNIVAFGRFDVEVTATAKWRPLRIQFKNSAEVRTYPAIEWKLTVPERLLIDPADSPVVGAGIDQFGAPTMGPGAGVTIINSDGFVTAAGSFP